MAKHMKHLKKPVEGKVISKPEDKSWKEWYEKLTPRDHEAMLSKLGISKEDREEFQKEIKKQKILP